MSGLLFKHKNKAQSYSDLSKVKKTLIFDTKSSAKDPESHKEQSQESQKKLLINRVVIKNMLVNHKIFGSQSRDQLKLNRNDISNPLFKFLSDDTLNYTALSEPEKKKHKEKIYNEHLKQTFLGLKAVKSLQKYINFTLKSSQIYLPVKHPNRKLLIFDLDETLIHCMGQRTAQVSVRISFPDGRDCMAGINLRPHLFECLEEAAKTFEVAVFTASNRCYADAIINYLDPGYKFFHHRLYREDCVKYSSFNIKDLRLINRKLKDIIIIDNSVLSFAFQLDNGVPIIPWINDPLDTELLSLIDYFHVVAEEEDVRELNRSLFRLDEFYEDYLAEFN